MKEITAPGTGLRYLRWLAGAAVLSTAFGLLSPGCTSSASSNCSEAGDCEPNGGQAGEGGDRGTSGEGGSAANAGEAGHGGANEAGRGGAAGTPAASGGEGGMGGEGGVAGAGGGAGEGGVTGEGGAGGTAPVGGAPTVEVFVRCGGVNTCPVHDGGRCCYLSAGKEYVCQGEAASCTTTGGVTGPYVTRIPFVCDGSEDCPDNQICCYKGSAASPAASVSCVAPEECFDSGTVPRYQICNPANTAPSDCLEGACRVFQAITQLSYCDNE